MSLFHCPTHGIHQGATCPNGDEISWCEGPSTYVTLEPPRPTLEQQWRDWERMPFAHGSEFDAKWDELMRVHPVTGQTLAPGEPLGEPTAARFVDRSLSYDHQDGDPA